jgi:hypothetical protein
LGANRDVIFQLNGGAIKLIPIGQDLGWANAKLVNPPQAKQAVVTPCYKVLTIRTKSDTPQGRAQIKAFFTGAQSNIPNDEKAVFTRTGKVATIWTECHSSYAIPVTL